MPRPEAQQPSAAILVVKDEVLQAVVSSRGHQDGLSREKEKLCYGTAMSSLENRLKLACLQIPHRY